jgi:predicted adenylyl cyclase CyaB
MVETEVKVRIQDPMSVRLRLLELGATVARDRTLEVNTLYDFPSSALRRGDKALRLRVAGKRATLTLKGPHRKSRSFKVREEFETVVRNAGQLRKILKALDLHPSFTYRKHRTVLRKGRLVICLDETSVGDFLELEGKRHEIVRFARSLGFARADFIRKDYVQLMEEETAKLERA